ncbi:hypothetical protein AN641_07560 [Candidatus Epulonipiscioides gigas]|nr:hypothetical protein AN641_07560 [Epulopiscium sp. SCG-C07WGA-EpuloA2]
MNFQAHITTNSLKDTQKYIALCEKHNVKPVLIKLAQGDYCDQPMYTQNIQADSLELALQEADELKNIFAQNGFETMRTKLEIDLKDLVQFYNIDIDKWKDTDSDNYFQEVLAKMGTAYFECHIKVMYNDLEILRKIANYGLFYMSKNDFEPNIRFLSMRKSPSDFLSYFDFDSGRRRRKYHIDINEFKYYVIELNYALEEHNMKIIKEKYEICVYDSKENLDKNWGEIMDQQRLRLEIQEELMIYIANNLPFVAKGSWLSYKYHPNPYERLSCGGDIDLIYTKTISLPKYHSDVATNDYYFALLSNIEDTLEPEITAILYKLEEIVIKKLDLWEQPDFITHLEILGYKESLKQGIIDSYIINYGASDDFTTISLIINYNPYFDNETYYIYIDIAVDMPINFVPQTIIYHTLNNEQVELKNTAPLLYQGAWKIHQLIVRPRLKDLDDLIRFLPYIDLKNEQNFQNFFNEIINECKLCDEITCAELINNLKNLLQGKINEPKKKSNAIDNAYPQYIKEYNFKYYEKLYAETEKSKLQHIIYDTFFEVLNQNIDCQKALEYINVIALAHK